MLNTILYSTGIEDSVIVAELERCDPVIVLFDTIDISIHGYYHRQWYVYEILYFSLAFIFRLFNLPI